MANLRFTATIVLLLCVFNVSKAFAQTPPWPVPTVNPPVTTPILNQPWIPFPPDPTPPMPVQNSTWPEWSSPTAAEMEQQARADAEARRAAEDARQAFEEREQRFREFFDSTFRGATPEEQEAQRQAALRADEKNYREMVETAKELAAFSQRIRDEIQINDERSVSKGMLKDLDRLEKLAKKVRSRGKRLPRK